MVIDLPAYGLADQLAVLLDKEDFRRWSHPLFESLVGRHRLDPDTYYRAARFDRGYVTDLRMRRTDDPRVFYEQQLAHVRTRGTSVDIPSGDHCTNSARRSGCLSPGKPALPAPLEVVGRSAADLPAVVTQSLCCYVNCWGSWEDAAAIAQGVAGVARAVPDTNEGARVLAVAASTLAIEGADRRARWLYREALRRPQHPYERFFIRMRQATAELKLFGDETAACDALGGARDEAMCFEGHGLAAEDREFAQGLVYNLRALVEYRAHRYSVAQDLIGEAARCLDAAASGIALPTDVAGRYRVTVRCNGATLDLIAERWSAALARYEDALAIAETQDPRSRAEVASLAGYALLRANAPGAATRYLLRAERLLRDDASPSRLQLVRRLLAVAADASGSPDEAKHWLSAAHAR